MPSHVDSLKFKTCLSFRIHVICEWHNVYITKQVQKAKAHNVTAIVKATSVMHLITKIFGFLEHIFPFYFLRIDSYYDLQTHQCVTVFKSNKNLLFALNLRSSSPLFGRCLKGRAIFACSLNKCFHVCLD